MNWKLASVAGALLLLVAVSVVATPAALAKRASQLVVVGRDPAGDWGGSTYAPLSPLASDGKDLVSVSIGRQVKGMTTFELRLASVSADGALKTSYEWPFHAGKTRFAVQGGPCSHPTNCAPGSVAFQLVECREPIGDVVWVELCQPAAATTDVDIDPARASIRVSFPSELLGGPGTLIQADFDSPVVTSSPWVTAREVGPGVPVPHDALIMDQVYVIR